MLKYADKTVPIYTQSREYAVAHDELNLYRESKRAFNVCAKALDKAIGDNYANNRLNTDAVFESVLNDFSPERICMVLANTVQMKDWDGRFSRDNKSWAKTILVPQMGDNYVFELTSHSGLVDLMVSAYRRKEF